MSQSHKKTVRKSRRRRRKQKRGLCFGDRPWLELNAAAIDVGARELWVAVPPGRDEQTVRVFDTFTDDLQQLVHWLIQCGITTVAMESTGVYWIPIYELLELSGIQACLVNSRHMKNVPGRRTDWHECQWLQYLHSVGLLRSAFRPPEQICAMRALMRQRGQLVQMACQHVQHMHKALTQMNLQIHHVIDDITGFTGLAIVDAIIGGQRDAAELAKLRHFRIKADPETIRKSLVGTWRHEHLFTLKQSREMYGSYQRQIEECDQELQRLLQAFQPKVDPEVKPLPPDQKKKRRRSNRDTESGFNLRVEMYKMFGVDVTQIPGLESLSLSLFTEIGRDLLRFPRAAMFASWLQLCPDNDISGGQWWSKARKTKQRAGQLFRLAANSLHRSQTPLGHFLRRMKTKLGPCGAILATARKIAIIFYTMVKNQVEYDETLWAKQDAQQQKRLEARLRRQAQQLGYQLVPAQS
jgi:transposase